MKDFSLSLPPDTLNQGDALLIVDVQNDFCPGGALPVKEGHRVIPVINHWIGAATQKKIPIYASRDWHPMGHISFQESGGPWPSHCVQDSDGARLHPGLRLPATTVMVTKGVRFDQDQNSAFDQTGLAERLRRDDVQRLWVAGLAEDVCVLATVLDGRKQGWEVMLIGAATRSITPESGERARLRMRDAGVVIV